jgi:hypothetical protein
VRKFSWDWRFVVPLLCRSGTGVRLRYRDVYQPSDSCLTPICSPTRSRSRLGGTRAT